VILEELNLLVSTEACNHANRYIAKKTKAERSPEMIFCRGSEKEVAIDNHVLID
jgi:hypothetical protein